MRFIWLGVLLLFTKTDQAFGDNQILIDKLASEYISVEKALWKKIDTQLILLDRGSFLSEIYREHTRILNNDFDEHKVVFSLGIQKYQRLINTVLSIDTNARNIKEYLSKSQYVKLVDLAQNAATQMQQSADELHAIIGQRSFWTDLVSVRLTFIRTFCHIAVFCLYFTFFRVFSIFFRVFSIFCVLFSFFH